jgi:hypothetical protein
MQAQQGLYRPQIIPGSSEFGDPGILEMTVELVSFFQTVYLDHHGEDFPQVLL